MIILYLLVAYFWALWSNNCDVAPLSLRSSELPLELLFSEDPLWCRRVVASPLHTVLLRAASVKVSAYYLIAFPCLCKLFNPGLHVSLFMNSVLLRVKLPRWLLQIPSARNGLPGTSHSEGTVLAQLWWTVTRACLHPNQYVHRLPCVKHCEWGVCPIWRRAVFAVVVIGITLWGHYTLLCV